MSLSIVTFADLGRKTNLKTEDIIPVVNTCAEKGVLHQVICRRNNGFSFKNTYSAIPKILYYSVKLLGKIIPQLFSSRRWEERIFDYYASCILQKTDICIFHGGYFLPKTFRAAKKQGMIVIDVPVTAHFKTNAELEKEELRLLGIEKYTDIYNYLYRTSPHANSFDYIIALSDFAKDSYIESGFPVENIFVAYQDIDIDKIVRTEKKDGIFRVLYMAHTSPLKGLHYLLEAWNSAGLENAELVIVGDYSEVMPRELQERYDQVIKNNSSIVWAGFSESPQYYYNQSSVFVLPSLTEGNPRVIMEAMACGLPVITTNHARSIIEDGVSGFVIPIRDAQAIKEKIEFLYRNPVVADTMGVEACRAIRHKKPFGGAVMEIYEDIIHKQEK